MTADKGKTRELHTERQKDADRKRKNKEGKKKELNWKPKVVSTSYSHAFELIKYCQYGPHLLTTNSPCK